MAETVPWIPRVSGDYGSGWVAPGLETTGIPAENIVREFFTTCEVSTTGDTKHVVIDPRLKKL